MLLEMMIILVSAIDKIHQGNSLRSVHGGVYKSVFKTQKVKDLENTDNANRKKKDEEVRKQEKWEENR
jgi:hypothetical protein